ncbi:MAG: SpoIID/LytB domain-containing protein [Ignavibacteriaceae bacterium]|nr:SpoIID/LytB domain-containing protein [Ignavibacteriaceae bacterium]
MLYDTQEPIIHVGILSENKINFELYGDFKSPGFSHPFSGRFTAELINDKIICSHNNEKIEVTDEIIFEPSDITSDSFLLRDVTIGVQFHWERKEKQRFTGAIKLIKENNKITAINSLPIENYLVSVISSEMSAKCSLELLKAHAIVSRGWLLAQIEKSRALKNEKKEYKTTLQTEDALIRWYDREDHRNFDVCADDHCQRYQGITKVFTTVAKQATVVTRGIALTENGKICDARYSKSCGGVSESFEHVWEPVKYNYLSSIVDYKFEPDNYNLDFADEKNARKWILGNPPAFCNTTDKKVLSQILLDYDQETTDFYRWTVTYTQSELNQLILKRSGIDFGEIIDLTPVERGASSRLIKLKIVGTKKTLTIGKELEIRRTLSPSHLYSSAFIVEKEDMKDGIPQKFVIKGAGWGHGVGLCQIGAAVMASQGYNFDEILLHYFTEAKLAKIY